MEILTGLLIVVIAVPTVLFVLKIMEIVSVLIDKWGDKLIGKAEAFDRDTRPYPDEDGFDDTDFVKEWKVARDFQRKMDQ